MIWISNELRRCREEDVPRESLLIRRRSRNLQSEFVALLDGSVMSVIARVVQLQHSNARDDDLDAIDRVLRSVVLERLYRLVQHRARSFSELHDELMSSIGRIGQADSSVAMREMIDEFGNFVSASEVSEAESERRGRTNPASLATWPRTVGGGSQMSAVIPEIAHRTILRFRQKSFVQAGDLFVEVPFDEVRRPSIVSRAGRAISRSNSRAKSISSLLGTCQSTTTSLTSYSRPQVSW